MRLHFGPPAIAWLIRKPAVRLADHAAGGSTFLRLCILLASYRGHQRIPRSHRKWPRAVRMGLKEILCELLNDQERKAEPMMTTEDRRISDREGR